ncbi:RlpA-like double-psi beta-barrel-protein domain-containing protein-containing protein, partial [Collybia nuda]
GVGACGKSNTNNDYVAAIAHQTFDTFPGAGPNPNNNPICGKRLKATYKGKSVIVKVVDRCAGCKGAHDIDMAPIAFRVLASENQGRLHGVQWNWTNSSAGPAVLEESD